MVPMLSEYDAPRATVSAAYLSWPGRPAWLPQPEGARWAECQTYAQVRGRIIDGTRPHAGVLVIDTRPDAPPGILPRLRVASPPPARPRQGRPLRMVTQADLARYMAWAQDIAGLGMADLALLLYGEDRPGAYPHIPRQIQRLAGDGRRLYYAAGVLPWCAYPTGRVPSAWRTDRAFVAGVWRWQLETIMQPAQEPQPGDLGGPLPEALVEAWRAARASQQRMDRLSRQVAAGSMLARAAGVQPWVPADTSAPIERPPEGRRVNRREPPPVRAPGPVTIRYECPICGGPHSRAAHPASG